MEKCKYCNSNHGEFVCEEYYKHVVIKPTTECNHVTQSATFDKYGDMHCGTCGVELGRHDCYFRKPMTSQPWEEKIEEICFVISECPDSEYMLHVRKIILFIQSLLSHDRQETIKKIGFMLKNTPEEVSELNKDLPSTLQRQYYNHARGYTDAIKDVLKLLEE